MPIIDVSTSGWTIQDSCPNSRSLYPCFKTENLIENSSQRGSPRHARSIESEIYLVYLAVRKIYQIESSSL